MLGLEADGGRLAYHAGVIVAEAPEMPVEGGGGQPVRLQLLEAVGCFDAVLGEQIQDAHRRQVAALAVGGAQLHGRDDLAPALDFGGGYQPRPAPVGATRVPRASLTAQQAVQGRPADGVDLGGGPDQGGPLGVTGRERRETPAKGRQRLGRDGNPGRHHTTPE